jgi:lipoprotein signal peptidase
MLTDEFLKLFFDAVLFGIVDNGVMLIGAFFGLGLEKYLPGRFQVGLGAIIGAGLGNVQVDIFRAQVQKMHL